MLVLLDNTILTNFALVGLTPKLRDLWGKRAATTEEVLEEYASGVEAGKLPRVDWTHLKTIALSSQEKVLANSRFPRLGKGERSCLIVASSCPRNRLGGAVRRVFRLFSRFLHS